MKYKLHLILLILALVLSVGNAQIDLCDITMPWYVNDYGFDGWDCSEVINNGPDSVSNDLLAMPCGVEVDYDMHLIAFVPFADKPHLAIGVSSAVSNPPSQPIVAFFEGSCQQATFIECAELFRGKTTIFDFKNVDTVFMALINSEEGENIVFCSNRYGDNCERNSQIIEVNSSCEQSFVGGPYCPGEEVEFCIQIEQFPFSSASCSWLGGIVPFFGEGWDESSFNSDGMPMVTKVIQPFGAATWDWYPDNDVHYNYDNFDLSINSNRHGAYLCSQLNWSCGTRIAAGDGLPRGWYAHSPDGTLPDDHPDNSLGDGVGCVGSGNWEVCFVLTASPSMDYYDASVGYTILSDGETGSWTRPGCSNDLSKIVPANICHDILNFPSDSTIEICSAADTIIGLPNNSLYTFDWVVDAPAEIEGAQDGQGQNLSINLKNSSNSPQSVVYYVTQTGDSVCFAFQLEVVVLSNLGGYFDDNLETCYNKLHKIPIPSNLQITSLDTFEVSAYISADTLNVVSKMTDGILNIEYLNTCRGQIFNDIIEVVVSDSVEYIENLSICAGDGAPFHATPIYADTAYTLSSFKNGCPANITYNISVINFGLPSDTIISCFNTIYFNARVNSNIDPSAMITWVLPNGNLVHADDLNINESGVYGVYSSECPDVFEIDVRNGFELNETISFDNCELANIQLSPTFPDDLEYMWSTGDTTASIFNLPLGSYEVTVTNTQEICTIVRIFNITLPDTCAVTYVGCIYSQNVESCNSDVEKFPLANQKLLVSPSNELVISDAQGKFELRLGEGNHTITPILQQGQFISCPASINVDAELNQPVDTIMFCVLDTSGCNLNINTASGLARPGQYVFFSTSIINQSGVSLYNVELTGQFDSQYDVTDYHATYPIASVNEMTNTITWNISEIRPGQSVPVLVTLKLSQLAMLGDLLMNSFSVTPACATNLSFEQVVRTSFDPNDKILENAVGRANTHMLRSDSIMDYVIRFQNTGEDTAFQIIVRDQLSDKLDLMSLTPGPSSHPYKWKILPNRMVEFTFNPIMLPHENINESASHGFVSFTVERTGDLTLGDEIKNNAGIYFDYNDAVITDTVVSEFVRPTLNNAMSFVLCPGDTFMMAQINFDTTIQHVVPFFDFDSVYDYHVTLFEEDLLLISTIAQMGDILFGQLLTKDTTFTFIYPDSDSPCDSIVQYLVDVISAQSDENKAGLSIFPNPTDDLITIYSDNLKMQSATFYSLSGEEMMRFGQNTYPYRMAVGDLVPGVYVLSVVEANQVYVTKIIKN